MIATAATAGTITIGGDLTIYRLGFGAMRLTGPDILGWPEDIGNAERVLQRAVELGVNFIDTAQSYGPDTNEELIAKALHPYPRGVVIATKGGAMHTAPGEWERDGRPQKLRELCEGSLRRLKLDTIDLYQLHAVDPSVPYADQIGALRDLRNEGKIRHVGLSNVTLEQLREAEKIVPIVSVQNRYNMGYRGQSEPIIDYCERNSIAFIPWFPLGGTGLEHIEQNTEAQIVAKAHGARVPQIANAWLLYRSKAMLPIPGTSSLQHLEENVAAAAIRLNDEDLVRLGLRQPKSAHHGEHDER